METQVHVGAILPTSWSSKKLTRTTVRILLLKLLTQRVVVIAMKATVLTPLKR